MYRFVITRTYVDFLISLEQGEKSVEECSKKIGITYNHLSNVVNQLKTEGVIDKEKSVLPYRLYLTKKGSEIVEHLKELKRIIETKEEPKKEPEKVQEEKKTKKGDKQ